MQVRNNPVGKAHRLRRGALVSAVLATAALLAPGTAVASPGAAPAGGAAAYPARNHAPAAPADLRTTDPDARCAADGSPVAVRGLTPVLHATLTDPDGDAVTATFTLRDGASGKRLWGAVTSAAQVSGADHAVRVPEGLLQDGRTYEWRVQAKDAKGRKSATVRCRIAVDATAPAAPEVSAVAGAAAVYVEDGTAGGIGVAGDLRFEAAAASGTVAFLYEDLQTRTRLELPAGETGLTYRYVPTVAGPQWVRLTAVDAAGNVSAERFYRFTVDSPSRDARWLLDERSGAVAADLTGTRPFALSASTTWTGGVLADLANRPTDGALLFDEPGDSATTAQAAVDAAGSYSVLAFVRLDETGTARTAVSQDSARGAAFELGTRTDGCPEGTAECWAFTVPGADADAAPAVAVSAVPVTAGSWVMLAGLRDAGAGTVQLNVCDLGSASAPGEGDTVRGTAVPAPTSASAAGPFRLGAALADGAHARTWAGAVSALRTYDGVLGTPQQFMACMSGS